MQGFEVGFRTSTRMRDGNQDVHLVHPVDDALLLVVCDGMGGAEGGGRAARICADTVRDHVLAAERPERLSAAIRSAHQAVRAEAARLGTPGMGTTVVAALVTETLLEVAWAGDSRLGLLDSTGFHWLTEDHVQDPGSSVLTRAVGIGEELDPAVLAPIALTAGDTLVLCSDGVHSSVDDGELFEILSLHPPDAALDRIDLVLERRAAEDNTTAIVLRIGEPFEDQLTVEIAKIIDVGKPTRERRMVLALVGVLVILALAALSTLLAQRLGAPL